MRPKPVGQSKHFKHSSHHHSMSKHFKHSSHHSFIPSQAPCPTTFFPGLSITEPPFPQPHFFFFLPTFFLSLSVTEPPFPPIPCSCFATSLPLPIPPFFCCFLDFVNAPLFCFSVFGLLICVCYFLMFLLWYLFSSMLPGAVPPCAVFSFHFQFILWLIVFSSISFMC